MLHEVPTGSTHQLRLQSSALWREIIFNLALAGVGFLPIVLQLPPLREFEELDPYLKGLFAFTMCYLAVLNFSDRDDILIDKQKKTIRVERKSLWNSKVYVLQLDKLLDVEIVEERAKFRPYFIMDDGVRLSLTSLEFKDQEALKQLTKRIKDFTGCDKEPVQVFGVEARVKSKKKK